MSDSFINKLTESSVVKSNDFTVFDVVDTGTGTFNTKKVSYATISDKLTTDITASLQTKINTLQTNLNTVSNSIANKLDKTGLLFGVNEKMTGTLYLNSNLSAMGFSHFNNDLDMHNHKIINLADPVNDYDAVNFKKLKDYTSGFTTPDFTPYLNKTTGGTMLSNIILPSAVTTNVLGAVHKQYVDGRIDNKFVPLSGNVGNTMTGLLILKEDPTTGSDAKQAATKKYVDDKINSVPTVDTTSFLKKDGTVTMDVSKNLTLGTGAVPSLDYHAVPLKHLNDNFLKLSGGTLTGSLILKGFSEKSASITGTGAVSLDMNAGNTFPINLTGNITGFTLTNAPSDSFSITMFITQTAAFTVVWSIGGVVVKWAGGIVPVVTTTATKTDVFCFTKVGSVWYGFTGGQSF